MNNSRFTVAVHILSLLALQREKGPVTSEYVAGSVNTNPVVIRRILANLRKAKLVSSSPGAGGGWLLARAPEKIHLSEIVQSLEPQPVFSMHSQMPNQQCPIGRNIQNALRPLFESADQAVLDTFAETTIAQILKQTLNTPE